MPTKQQRFEQRKSMRESFNELLTLLLQKAGHDVLLEKVQLLHRKVEPLLGKLKRQR